MRRIYVFCVILGVSTLSYAQIDGNLLLGLTHVTTAEMSTISNPVEGSLVYNTTEQSAFVYTGGSWDVSSKLPADLADGDDDTQYTAGSGMLLSSTEFSVDNSSITPDWSNIQNIPSNLDTDSANELQTISKSGNEILLNQGGGSVFETETSISQNTSNGEITFTNEATNTSTAVVISGDANNDIKTGSDGGAYIQTKIFDCYNSVGYNLTPGFSTVRLNTTRINNSTSVYSLNTSNNEVTINETGVYEVEYTVSARTNTWSYLNAKLELNGSDITASEVSNGGWYKDSSATRKLYLNINSGDELRIRARRRDASGSGTNDVDILAFGCSLTIKKLY